MILSLVTGPTTLPVSADDLRSMGRLDDYEDAIVIEKLIEAAARMVGEYAGRSLLEETWALSIPAIHRRDLMLPKSPVRSITSITYFDGADAEQTANVSDFYLMKDDDRAILRPKSGESWPAANTDRDDAITITFVAGYTDIPPTLVHAVKMMALHLVNNREAVSDIRTYEVPLGIQNLINVERLGWAS